MIHTLAVLLSGTRLHHRLDSDNKFGSCCCPWHASDQVLQVQTVWHMAHLAWACHIWHTRDNTVLVLLLHHCQAIESCPFVDSKSAAAVGPTLTRRYFYNQVRISKQSSVLFGGWCYSTATSSTGACRCICYSHWPILDQALHLQPGAKHQVEEPASVLLLQCCFDSCRHDAAMSPARFWQWIQRLVPPLAHPGQVETHLQPALEKRA